MAIADDIHYAQSAAANQQGNTNSGSAICDKRLRLIAASLAYGLSQAWPFSNVQSAVTVTVKLA